jgi:hypothetical protein
MMRVSIAGRGAKEKGPKVGLPEGPFPPERGMPSPLGMTDRMRDMVDEL